MKIEMAESLLRSWLRHVEGCQVAELNWKPSSAWGFDPNDTVSNLFDHAVINFPKVIKKNTLSQFIKQAEIDVLGIKIGAEGKVDKIYAFDSAFHTGGLNYGSAEETRNRVQKKLFRTALLLESYFPSVPACVEFVAPMASPAIHNRVTEATELVRENLKVLSHIQFEYTGREAFAEKFLHPLLDLKSDIADTSELFMRSWQLVESFLTAAPKETIPAKAKLQRVFESRRSHGTISQDVIITALYLARFEHQKLETGNQGETINNLAAKLDVNPKTLRNYRDAFDFHVDNHRNGWDAPLSEKAQEILERYSSTEEPEYRELVLNLF